MELLVLNTEFEAVAVVDSYESLIWTDRYNECGDFELYFPIESSIPDFLREDYYLRMPDSEHCMVIETLKIESDAEDGSHLIVSGRSLESILERRIIWGQSVFTGNLQTAVQSMIQDNIISPSIEDRKIDNFVFEASTDSRITELEIDAQYTGDDLYSVVKSLCEENGIGFEVVPDSTGQFVFRLYVGTDRSCSQTENPYVIFSPSFENIINSNFCVSKSEYRNVTLVGGEGEGASRKTAIAGSASGLERRELFTDANDISSDTDSGTLSDSDYANQLIAKGEQSLAEHRMTTAFEGEVDATQLFVYGEDFFLGDIVQIANEYGHECSAYISELVFSHDKDGSSVYPTFKSY